MNFDDIKSIPEIPLPPLPEKPVQNSPLRRSNRLKERALKIENEAADVYFKSLKENKDLMNEVVDGPLPLLRMLACPPPNVDWWNMLLSFKRMPKPLNAQQKKYYDIFLLKCDNIPEQRMPENIRREYCKILMKQT